MKADNPCADCDFEENGGCVCSSMDKWYACPIEAEKLKKEDFEPPWSVQNRLILFRAKTLYAGEWVYSERLQHGERTDGKAYFSVGMWLVKPETLGQFTGQSDRNGVKIFEGDILDFTDDEGEKTYYRIFFDDENCRFALAENGVKEPAGCGRFVHENMTVVGNIYDNPELLEVKK